MLISEGGLNIDRGDWQVTSETTTWGSGGRTGEALGSCGSTMHAWADGRDHCWSAKLVLPVVWRRPVMLCCCTVVLHSSAIPRPRHHNSKLLLAQSILLGPLVGCPSSSHPLHAGTAAIMFAVAKQTAENVCVSDAAAPPHYCVHAASPSCTWSTPPRPTTTSPPSSSLTRSTLSWCWSGTPRSRSRGKCRWAVDLRGTTYRTWGPFNALLLVLAGTVQVDGKSMSCLTLSYHPGFRCMVSYATWVPFSLLVFGGRPILTWYSSALIARTGD